MLALVLLAAALLTATGCATDGWDARDAYPHCRHVIGRITDQGSCDACWAVSAVQVVADHLCIRRGANATTTAPLPFPSAGQLLSCCTTCANAPCGGADARDVWDHITQVGLAPQACSPYPFPPCDHGVYSTTYSPTIVPPCSRTTLAPVPACNRSCAPHASLRIGGVRKVAGELRMRRALHSHGPLQATMILHQDLYDYAGGIYAPSRASKVLGLHAVRIVGYGQRAMPRAADGEGRDGSAGGAAKGVERYWIVANSWNDAWGDGGYALVRRGVNAAGIEGDCRVPVFD